MSIESHSGGRDHAGHRNGGPIALLIGALALMALLLNGCADTRAREIHTTIVPLPGEDSSLAVSTDCGEIVLSSETTSAAFLGTQDCEHCYTIGDPEAPNGTLSVVVRTLPGGAYVVFTRLEALRSDLAITGRYRFGATTASFETMDLADPPEPVYDRFVGCDRTTNPAGLAVVRSEAATEGVVLVGKSYESRELRVEYADGGTSRLRELVGERASVSVSSEASSSPIQVLESAGKGTAAERVLLVVPGEDPLGGLTVEQLRETAVAEFKWVTPEGTYVKIPRSTPPDTKDGYGVGLRALRAEAITTDVKITRAPIAYAMLFNNLATLARIRDVDGLWRTPYTSSVVAHETDIHAPYVDTRHNEAFAFHVWDASALLSADGVQGADELAEWGTAYGTYLEEKIVSGQVVQIGGGFYLHDYYDDDGTQHSYVSLNHTLGQMEYFLTLYERTDDPKWLGYALSIKSAVDSTGRAWIAEDGDLYYQMNVDGSFAGNDYATVTLRDLQHSQTLFERILGERDPVFDELIASKTAYNERAYGE